MLIADKLAELLREVESRELVLSERESSSKAILEQMQARESAVSEREQSIREESAKLEEYRNVAQERQRTQNMVNQLRRDEEALADLRSNFAREQAGEQAVFHKMKVELSGLKDRIAQREAELLKQEEELKSEKVKHHERVIKDLSEIELKKMRIS